MSDFDPFASDAPLIVYFDIKSPYAFIAKDPTLALADELGIAIDWRPLTLDIPSYLGSARLNASGGVASSTRTPEQWSGVRYAYMDARRYGSAYGYTLRGTTKIWDTSLIHIAFAWVKREGDDQAQRRFLDAAYPAFWRRELDVEDPQVAHACIENTGVSARGFAAWAGHEGRAEHDAQQAAVFAAGVYGVPGYVVNGEFFFGREHLPAIGALLGGRSRREPLIDVGNPLPALDGLPGEGAHRVFADLRAQAAQGELEVLAALDFGCADSRRAAERLLELETGSGGRLRVTWLPHSSRPAKSFPEPDADGSRGDWHRYHRARYRLLDRRRYLGAGADTSADPEQPQSVEWAAQALLRLNARAPDQVGKRLLDLFARASQPSSQVAEFAALLDDDAGDWLGSAAAQAAQAEAAERLIEAGVSEAFGFAAGGAPFVGRQHLAALEWALR
ncbi:MAG: DsbA family protein [Pseudomonadota bacterium]